MIVTLKSSTCDKLYCCQYGLSPFIHSRFVSLFKLVVVKCISKFLQLSSFKPSISLQQGAQPTQNALYHNQKLAIQPNEVLLLFLLNTLIVDHIFSCLPMILSLSWHLCQISKSWFRVMSESMAWNALEITTINHRSYLQSIIIHDIVKQSILTHFEFEFQRLNVYMQMTSFFNIIQISTRRKTCRCHLPHCDYDDCRIIFI